MQSRVGVPGYRLKLQDRRPERAGEIPAFHPIEGGLSLGELTRVTHAGALSLTATRPRPVGCGQHRGEVQRPATTLPFAVHCTTIAVRTLEDPFVDDQITVRLPAPLGRTLRRTARRLGRRPSHVVRMALEAFLQGAPAVDGKRSERVEHLIGSLSSGIPDLAERHREYVLASLKHAR